MTSMDYFHNCSCSSRCGVDIKDLLNCAPCPPPSLSYMELKKTALGKLCQEQVCNIAKRCRMAKSSVMMTDCLEPQPPILCDLTCIMIVVCVLTLVVVAILVVAVCRRKKDVGQDTINVVFNDTDSESSDKSSHKGTINMAMKQALESEFKDGIQQSTYPESSGADEQAMGDMTPKNDMKCGNGVRSRDISNVHFQNGRNGVRSRTYGEGQDAYIVAKL